MRLGICTSINNTDLAHSTGFDYVEISVGDLLPTQDDAAFAAVRGKAEASPIPIEACNCFVPGNIKVAGPVIDEEAIRTHMTTTLRRCAEIGISVMVFGSGGARQAPEGFPVERALEQYADAVRIAAEIGARYGVTIAMEPLAASECNVFHTVAEGIRIVDTLQHPNAKVLADSFHMLANNEPFDNIITAGKRLAHIHIDMPDVAAINAGADSYFPRFIAALTTAGYDGRVSIEPHGFKPAEGKKHTDYYQVSCQYLKSLFPSCCSSK